MVFSVPSLEKRFFIFRLTGLTHPISRKVWVPRFARTQGGGFFQSILQFSPTHYGLYIPLVFLLVFLLLLLISTLPPPHYQKTRTQERKTSLLKLEKKSTQLFKKPFFRRVEEFLESSLAQNSLTVGARLCQSEFVVAIYAHIHKREAAQVFLAQF